MAMALAVARRALLACAHRVALRITRAFSRESTFGISAASCREAQSLHHERQAWHVRRLAIRLTSGNIFVMRRDITIGCALGRSEIERCGS